jgi:endonuclease/exonuclease/phosphatase family metal-dependent hydrolase
MRLLQLNLWEGRLIRQIPAFVKRLNPDIICMQEVFSSESKLGTPTDMFSSLQKIRTAGDYPYSFFSPLLSSVYAGENVDYGNAILSKFPLSNEETLFTEGSYNRREISMNVTPGSNNLQVAEVSSPQSSFYLANHQGYWEINRLGDEVSVQKMTLVSDRLRKCPTPLILAGDLNVTAESPAMRVFDGFLEDLTATHGITTTLSDLGKVNDAACDHILISPGIRVQNYYVADDLISDHKAVVLDFELIS